MIGSSMSRPKPYRLSPPFEPIADLSGHISLLLAMNARTKVWHTLCRLRAVLAVAAHPILGVDVIVSRGLQVVRVAELLRLVLDLWPRKCFCSPAIALASRIATPLLGFDSFYAA